MRRSVQSALHEVRKLFKPGKPALSGPAWSVARVLADEVDRLHARFVTDDAPLCRITGNHPYAFRSGTPATILGVCMKTPMRTGKRCFEPRPCFHVRFDDGVEDFIPLDDYKRLTGVEAYAIGPADSEDA